MKHPTVKFLVLSRTVLAILISVFMLISAIGCGAGEPQSQGVAWQLDTFALRYNCTPITESSPDISPIVKPGQDVYIYAEIRNVGTEAGAYEWQVYLDNADNPFYHETTSNLVAGSSEGSSEVIGNPVGLVCITISSEVIGRHEVKIGTVTRHFTVVTVIPSAAQISNLSIDPFNIPAGQETSVNFTVCNPGEVNEIYTVNIFIGDYKAESKSVSVNAGACVPVVSHVGSTTPGTYHVLITADGSSSQVAGTFQVFAETGTSGSGLTAGTPLTFTSTTLADGFVSKSYTAEVKPAGGTTPYTYSLTSGSLPAGLSIHGYNDFCRIEGTPTAYGQFEFEITVDDSNESTSAVKATFNLMVFPNLDGKWMMTTTVTQANGVCAGEGGTSTREITVTQNGKSITFSDFTGSQANQLIGAILPPNSSFIDVIKNTVIRNDTEQWIVYVSGSYPEDFGTTTSSRRLVINTTTTMSGVEDWTWVGGGGDCPDGKGVITATRIP